GVRRAEAAGLSWWNTALVRADQSAVLAVQSLEATRFATAIASQAEAERLVLDVTCGATPPVAPVEGSWGYDVLAPPALALALPGCRDGRGADPRPGRGGLAGARGGEGGRPPLGWRACHGLGELVPLRPRCRSGAGPRQRPSSARTLRRAARVRPRAAGRR